MVWVKDQSLELGFIRIKFKYRQNTAGLSHTLQLCHLPVDSAAGGLPTKQNKTKKLFFTGYVIRSSNLGKTMLLRKTFEIQRLSAKEKVKILN